MEKVRCAIIGAGFGGLALGIRLQAAGFETTIFEARDKPGGRAYVYEQDGFTFDAGPTVITAPDCLEELFSLAGRDMKHAIELIPVRPYYRLIWDDGDSFDYVGDSESLLAQIRTRSEEDASGYLRFLDYSRRLFEKGYEELGAVPFLRFWDMVKVAPSLVRLRADRSVYAAVSDFFKDEHLRQAFSFHSLLVGGNPFQTSAIYTLIHYLERKWGVFFPKGGTGALVRTLVRLFEDLGGNIHLHSPVARIRVKKESRRNKHVVETHTDPGQEFDLVASNSDLHHTYSTLLRGEKVAARTAQRLERKKWSMSLFVVYFGVNRRYDELAHHTVLFGPRYKGLLEDIFLGPGLADDFSLYLHAPTVTDASLAPPVCEAFYVLSPVPHLGNADLDWSIMGPKYADRILAHLERWLPDLRRHVVTRRIFSPADFKTELFAHHGSAFSLAPTLSQSAYFRPHNKDPRIPGLYLVGAGTHPGAGVPGVLNSAKATAKVIMEDFPCR